MRPIDIFSDAAWLLNWAGIDAHACALPVADHGDTLFDLEKTAVANAVPARIAAFSTGRCCARQALQAAGLPVTGLARTRSGNAAWPSGCCASISHCPDLAIALVSTDQRVLSLGVDIEYNRPLTPGVADLVTSEPEKTWLASGTAPEWAPLAVFSLKESVFKCLHPLLDIWIGFDAVAVCKLADPLTGPLMFTSADKPVHPACIMLRDQQVQLQLLSAELQSALANRLNDDAVESWIHASVAVFARHVVTLVWLEKPR